MSKLHIYAQPYNHSDAWIVGNRESLTALRDALNLVLGVQPLTEPETFVGVRSFAADGEGYTVLVLRVEEEKVWEQLILPYADLCDKRERSYVNTTAWHPFHVVSVEDYRRVVRGR